MPTATMPILRRPNSVCNAVRSLAGPEPQTSPSTAPSVSVPPSAGAAPLPAAFANGRYQVKKLLGEGGKKKVYLAHDSVLDRDVAIYLIKTEKLDETGRTRIHREAQAMARLGDHSNIASVHDYGDHEGQPYMVAPLLSGGDVEGLIKKAADHKLPLDKSIEIAKSVCKGLEFAHGKGIIHRDIKPGNVMLGADGTAKVNDFGLAVAVDLSRLTQMGMMVGTVSYMPPEQAMGGEVTAKADLYSLGAMLYEMVTGRPPFVGDDSVAIIGQHINTPPVSPSWHRADLPPALETLIMQLLEKDPEKRPASATVVLQALESIGVGKPSTEQAKEAAAPPENPLYRRVFVGREAELKQLQSAFDGAMSGQGALMMVLGEPGIGKTALCEQLATYVTLRGGRTLVGHCYEEGSLSLPYLAFVEAMRSYVLDRDPNDLKKELGSGATDVARIVSEIREKLDVKPRASENPEEDRYRLLQSVTSFLTNAASVKPLFVLLEDLHDADKGTLEMLTYVSRNLSGARLLVVGTYRDVEVDRTHPLSAALAELRRVSTFGRVVLRGLNADEVHRMLKSITHDNVPWSLAEAVHRQTEGNPLFVQEVVRYLSEEGLLKREGGRWKGQTGAALDMAIPEGLRDVIGKRVSLLSKDCSRLLSVASVIGREFGIETLRTVAAMGEDAFVAALKEAVRLSVLEERLQVGQVRYRFTHAFFRQTLYEEMIAPQRLQLHQQVARVLEAQYAGRLEEHAAELAEHFSQSTDRADLAKAVLYGEMAATRASKVYAYGEAVRLLGQALMVQRVLGPKDVGNIVDLLLDLGEALYVSGAARRAVDIELSEAFSLAEANSDTARASRACTLAMVGLIYHSGTRAYSTPEFSRWLERADRYAAPNSVGRAWADFGLGALKLREGNATRQPVLLAEGVRLQRQARELSGRLDDADAFWFMSYQFLNPSAPQFSEERLRLAEELLRRPRSGVATRTLSIALILIGGVFEELGQRDRADEVWKEVRELAERTQQPNAAIFVMAYGAMAATWEGRFDDAEETARQILARGEQLGISEFASFAEGLAGSFYSTYFRDREELSRRLALAQPPWMRAALMAHLGRNAEVKEILEKEVIARRKFGSQEDYTPVYQDVAYLHAAASAGHTEAAQLLLGKLAYCGLKFVAGMGCVARYLGEAAAFLGEYDAAKNYYIEAMRACTELRERPGLALTRLQLAELLLEHYPTEKKDALEHLDFAIKEFREMKMQPSLERALRHKEILKA